MVKLLSKIRAFFRNVVVLKWAVQFIFLGGLIALIFNYLNKTLNAYNLSLTKEFNQIVLSLQIVGGLSKKLTKDIHIEQIKVFKNLTQANKLLEIY